MAEDALTGYENEPGERFEALPPRLHSQYYHYERLSGELQAELCYYRSQFSGRCSRLLELGCGTSIIASDIADHGINITGIDLCREMLTFRRRSIENGIVQMDMCSLGFTPCFDGALIAHNTLNLLGDERRIRRCLTELRRVLIPPGIVVAHLYTVDPDAAPNADQRWLQFHIFDLPTGEKIVKESITNFTPDRNVLRVDQRYKCRDFSQPRRNRNYRQILELAAFPASKWLTMLSESGFTPVASTSTFSDLQPESASTLVVTARAYQ